MKKKLLLITILIFFWIGLIGYWSSLINQINNKCRNYWLHAYDNWDDSCVCEEGYFMQKQKTLEDLCVKIDDLSFCWEHWKLLSTNKEGAMIYKKCGCEEGYLFRTIWTERKCHSYDWVCKNSFWNNSLYASWTATGNIYDAEILCECPVWFTISEWKCRNKWEIKKLDVYVEWFSKWWIQIWYYNRDWMYYSINIVLGWSCDMKNISKWSSAYIDLWTDKIISKNDTIIFPTNQAWCIILSYEEKIKYWWLRNVLWPNKEKFWLSLNVVSKSAECTKKWGVWNVKKKTCVTKKK